MTDKADKTPPIDQDTGRDDDLLIYAMAGRTSGSPHIRRKLDAKLRELIVKAAK